MVLECIHAALSGVAVELLVPPPATAPRIEACEELGALPLFQLYAQHVAMPDHARAAGAAILQARLITDKLADHACTPESNHSVPCSGSSCRRV